MYNKNIENNKNIYYTTKEVIKLITNNTIIVERKDFEIKHTLECGQLFRYKNCGSHYELNAQDKKCILYNRNSEEVIIESEDYAFFYNYFDLKTDYSEIKRNLIELPLMRSSIENGYGIRILRQDPFETIISFIISANNNIPRIQKIIERICINGAFPTPQDFARHDESYFNSIGAGYRARYLDVTSKILNDDKFDINTIKHFNGTDANKYLCTNLLGVGEKVADCILLFGFHMMDVFPVDTWIKKVYQDIFQEYTNAKAMRRKLIETYGELSGYAQQYLFYNKRG